MKRSIFIWPITPHWIYQHLKRAGYAPRTGGVRTKSVDHKALRIKFSIQLPLKHAALAIETLKVAIKGALLFRVIALAVRKNKHWVGVTLTLDATRLTPSRK